MGVIRLTVIDGFVALDHSSWSIGINNTTFPLAGTGLKVYIDIVRVLDILI